MFTGYERRKGPEAVYVASNAYWEELEATLPELPQSMRWELAANTWEAEQHPGRMESRSFRIPPRSVMVFAAK
jgi:glycogen operon protein